jgi:cytochrome c2
VRMPEFSMSDQDASTIADYLEMVMQSPNVASSSVDTKAFTPEMAKLGKQLYEVKYQCQSCHTIGATGGYVGPALSVAGDWLQAAWIEAWLKNPQALVPDTIEPRRSFTDQEITALTAYLVSLKQHGAAGAAGGAR